MDLSPDEDNFQGRLLHQAALWDNVELLQELLSSGADCDARDEHGRTALHAAALAERSRCVAALCAAGTSLDVTSDSATGGKTALHIAAERGHVENVRALLAAGAGVDVQDAGGDTALALAERGGHRHAAHALRDARDALERERLAQHGVLRELLSRGDQHQLRHKLQALGRAGAAPIIANLTPNGANTLLYIAAEAGLTTAVAALLEAGADGREHPVTRYCPLYAAACHGHVDVSRLLLAHFPHAVQQETVEQWLPLHAAVIGGHPAMVSLLLEYPYPEAVLNTYTDASGQYTYRFSFDVNARDVSGQTALYVACTLGNLAVVDALLSHSVLCEDRSRSPTEPPPPPPPPPQVLSPGRAGISLGIHAIVNKLTGSLKKEQVPSLPRVHPVRTDVARGGDSCVACATRAGHARVVKRLLAAGAAADAPASPPDAELSALDSRKRRSRSASATSRLSSSPSPARYSDRDGPWTALAVAAHAKNVQIVEMLLAAGASDPHCRALRECARHGLLELVAALLATKAYPDPDSKLNKSSLSELVFHGREADSALTYSALCPTTPAMVNWREMHCHIAHIRMSWLRAAALRVNPRLASGGGGGGGGGAGAVHALTRLDVSNNELRGLPPEIFTLLSLRYLNAAQNKLERLPSLSDPFEEDLDSKGRKVKKPKKGRPEVYSAPVLQELYLQDNRLEELPPGLFSLPALTTLDVSNNKLRHLPAAVWAAPALRDLNVALNHLRDLPTHDESVAAEPPGPAAAAAAQSPTDSQLSSSPSLSKFQLGAQSKTWSRSPSIESDVRGEDVPTVGGRAGNAVWSEARRAHTWRGVVEPAEPAPATGASPLSSLNLSHNQFTCIPPALACLAPALTRLNMAYNSLRSMSYVTSYPTALRQLDLSHNEVTCWPSLPQVENFGSDPSSPLACHCRSPAGRAAAPRTAGGDVRSRLLAAVCPARRHLRLEGLRTLILANNMLTRIQLTTDDDGLSPPPPHDGSTDHDDDDDWGSGSRLKGRLLFPLLSMLDVSSNMLRQVPPAIHELTHLAVLNIEQNKDITDLPPTMGLLSRLWNLNAGGCSLQEPLRSMLQGGKYKSMDVVGYLKSVLQEARPYARMKLMLTGLQGIGKTSLLECLRQESAIQHRRRPTEHWAKRMGNKSARRGGGNMSTVGVDIGTWVYEKQRSTRGPVTFRTWDFGGQQEYYATHQYFLSRRSLYVVVWRVTDGRRGLAGAISWLRSIQARAPGSPAILVATHYDQVASCNLPESESPEVLQRLIRSSIMGAADADKLGLPRVLDSVEVSCSTRHNIRLLADIIYWAAFSVKPPGSKEPLLEQQVPATYLALEECVTSLAADLKEPVLRHDEYKRLVTQYMQQKNLRMFRDAAELHQATMFLHENGVLLHYDDASLKELYFLRPQWLCDVLAHVVTIREINPFATNGIMKLEDLCHVFKASPALSLEAGSHGVSLLNKFELALSWDARRLLVPPLLPKAEPQEPQLPLRARTHCWAGSVGTPQRVWNSMLATCPESTRGTDSPTLVSDPSSNIVISGRCGGPPIRRLLLLSYIPCGFWPRLCTRVLHDTAIKTAAPGFYSPPVEMELDDVTSKALDLNWGWKLWKTGLKLVCGDITLVAVRELPARRDALLGAAVDEEEDPIYRDLRLRVKQEGSWCSLDVQSSSCVEITLPAQVCVLRRHDNTPIGGYQSISLSPSPSVLARVLALVADHVDLLLEDWYPSLGTRFVHTSEGRCLITRVVPCPGCLKDLPGAPPNEHAFQQAFKGLELAGGGGEGGVSPRGPRPRLSEESRASDGDSGVGAESNASSRLGSVEGVVNSPPTRVAFGWSVEECIHCACTGGRLHCSHHQVQLRDVAPDVLLLDVDEDKRARWEHVSRGSVCGRGAFGTVLGGVWRRPGTAPADALQVAIKALQPIPPPATSDTAAMQAYKAALSRWERDPTSAACRAYCALRQELSILTLLRHPHVVPLLGVCVAPLLLLLPNAPQGALDGVLREYRGCGARVGVRAARAVALQAARALEYIHARRVVYRDLKSENVLVWSMPRPHEAPAAERSSAPIPVHVKLADYGISRLAPPSGTKGFGGTEGFMAPEIMRYNGEEEYNEKVDCFSYGMLLYEVVSLRQPFEGHEAVKEAVLDGGRPTLSPRELQWPCSLLETMRRCWASAPELRPSAAALVCIAAAPELIALQDVAAARVASCAAATPVWAPAEESALGWEVWYAGEPERVHTLLTTPHSFTHHHTIRVPPAGPQPVTVTAMCRVGSSMWLGDSAGRVTVYSVSTCALSWSVSVQEAVGGAASSVAALQPLPALDRVALALQSGRLFMVTAGRPAAGGGFVLSELGAATELACLAAVTTPHGMELWAGGDALYCYAVGGGGVSGAELLPAQSVRLLAAPRDEPCVLAYCHPGVCVYQWSVVSKELMNKLDCSKLAPCSESIQTLDDDEMSGAHCRVTSMCVLEGRLYVGTGGGCVVVADCSTLRPLTVFRVYQEQVSAMIPLYAPRGSEQPCMLATLGTGYRPLLNRYAPPQATSTNYSGPYCLLWRAQHWLPD